MKHFSWLATVFLCGFLGNAAYADEVALSSEQLSFLINNLWLLMAAAMVFIMHLG